MRCFRRIVEEVLWVVAVAAITAAVWLASLGPGLVMAHFGR
jgi:hypothetical protein